MAKLTKHSPQDIDDEKCRLDKWLWAARFFKTRSIAVDAVDSGKVRLEGDRTKPAKEVKVGMRISIRTKELTIEVEVRGLSNQRRGAPEAQLLYQETVDSIAKREMLAITKQDQYGNRDRGTGRPTKRQIRDIKKFTGM